MSRNWITERKHKTGKGFGGMTLRGKEKLKYPLRKVIGREIRKIQITETEYGYEALHQILECGHALTIPNDIFGNYYPSKRRCGYCYKALQTNKNSMST